MTTTLPCGAVLTVNEATITETLATLLASFNEAMMFNGPSAAAAAASVLREAGPTVAAAEGSNRRAAVHATTALNGAVQPLPSGADLSAPYYDCTTDSCGASIELGEK